MGATCAALFDDDGAKDVRDLYRTLKSLGIHGEEAVGIVLNDNNRDDPTVWLALADLMARDGTLVSLVKDRALEIITRGGDAELYLADKDRRKRAKVLDELARRINSPRPVPPRLKKRFRDPCPWETGTVVAKVHAPTGLWVVMRVRQYWTKFGDRSPVVEVLDWKSTDPPAESQIGRLGFLDRDNDYVVTGCNRPERTLAHAIASGYLPADATWQEYVDETRYPSIALIRTSERDTADVIVYRTPNLSPRRESLFKNRVTAWTPWKHLDTMLTSKFPRFRMRGSHWPDHMLEQ